MEEVPSSYDSKETAIIQEIYEGENSYEVFENELDRALEAGYATIIVEPSKLGEETARWIYAGNCLHKTAVLTGFASLASGLVWPERLLLYCPAAAVSLFCTGLYTVSWMTDPCSKYQVSTDPERLAGLRPLSVLSSSVTPVVLVRRDDTKRNLLHTFLSLLATGYCVWRICKVYGSS